MTEADLQALILRELGSRPDVRLFRNNTGQAWVGKLIRRNPDGSVLIAHARPLHAGLFVGSADLIGWLSIPGAIAPTARFLSIEVKSATGRPTEAQVNWQAAILRAGGIAGVVSSVEEAVALIT